MSLSLAFFVGFIGLQFIIGAVMSRYVRSGRDFFVAGRKQGIVLVTFSVFATWFGSETCFSTVGRVYESGLFGARSDPLGYTVCLFLYGVVFARRLWSENVVTLSDVLKERFCLTTQTLCAIISIITSLFWAAAQLRAFGHVLSSQIDISLEQAILVATIVCIAYTSIGGLVSDSYIDIVQGIVLIAGLIVTIFFAFSSLENPIEILANIPAERLFIFDPSTSFLENIDAWLVPIAGSLVAQELIMRVSAARNQSTAAKGAFAATIIYFLAGLIPMLLGFIAPALLGHIDNSEEALLLIAKKYLPLPASLLFFGALVSAILSTVDSTLLACSSLITRNLIGEAVKLDGKKELFYGRLSILIMGILACYLSTGAEKVHHLVESASSFGTAGIFVIFLAALFSPYGSHLSGKITLIAGVLATIFFDYVFVISASYFWAIVVCVIVFALSEYVHRRRSLR